MQDLYKTTGSSWEYFFLYEWCQNGILTNFYLKYLAAQQGFFHLKRHIFVNSL